MITISDEDARLLVRAVEEGEAVLFLGAGASATSTLPPTRDLPERPIKQGWQLAKLIAEAAGLTYDDGDELPDVLGGVLGARMSEEKFHRILAAEFTNVRPSVELQQLFDYTWRRAYTWNIDDSVTNIRGSVQVRRPFNGISDKVSEQSGLEYLQFIFLHGDALKPEHGFIFSPSEYNKRISENKHDWYRQAASDYAIYTPIFIGSRLKEPILSLELDRARPTPGAGLGLAYLVTPDKFSEVKLADLKARNIVVITATLSEFVAWLRGRTGKAVTPIDVAQRINAFTKELTAKFDVNSSDVDTAQSIIVHTWKDTKRDADEWTDTDLQKAAQNYLEGGPPTWKISATDVPVWLSGTEKLYKELKSAIEERARVFIVYGQSGSGKTTATIQSLLRIVREDEKKRLYELKSDVKSLRASLNLISRLHKGEHVLVYIGDAFIYGDSLYEDISSISAGNITVVTGARSNEWREHIERRIGDISVAFQYQRFSEDDFQPLIDRLLEYVPAPRFKKMPPAQRVERLRASRSQLLIALKEATESEKFTSVITREFKALSDDACRALALIVGISTIARTGISASAAREAYRYLGFSRTFEHALQALDGIVSETSGGRFVARHEVYVRHIIDNVAPFADVVSAIVSVLRTYTKYNTPIVKNVGRQDALLFKFLLNHNFNADLARRRNDMDTGLRVYDEFSVDFQLDGHYWLQYGQYLVEKGDLEDALSVLNKSIQAYPDNAYAMHAYADVQLRVAMERRDYDSKTIELIGDAVKSLELQHTRKDLTSDQYPIVTLSERHIGALIRHAQTTQALPLARRYFREVEELTKRNNAIPLQRAKERLAQYITSGIWAEGNGHGREGAPRRRRGHSGRPTR